MVVIGAAVERLLKRVNADAEDALKESHRSHAWLLVRVVCRYFVYILA